MLNLQTASREELIRLIVQQHETIARQERQGSVQQEQISQLTAQVAALTTRVTALLAALDAATAGDDDASGSGSPTGMPGHKPRQVAPQPPKPRKRRTQQFVRRRALQPTAQVMHALDVCPRCGAPLTDGSVKRTREVIEVPLAPVTVTEHVSRERCCPCCHTRHTPPVALHGQVAGRQRFGVGLVSLIATLREEGRWPIATIQWYFDAVHGLRLSVGAITAAIQRVAQAGTDAVVAIREAVRASPVAHRDETGWRENGVNGYVWTASTPTARYFMQGSRAGTMVDAILGDAFAGVLVSDFYGAYQHYPGVKQKCWAHLLRDLHALTQAHATDGAVQAWAAGVHDVSTQAVRWVEEHPAASGNARQATAEAMMRQMQAVCKPWVDTKTPVGTLSRRMEKHRHELFVFVVEPRAPSDNNAAERSLRHVVTSRKISGGTRSAAGSAAKMALATLFGTWRVRGENPLAACRALLLSPHP